MNVAREWTVMKFGGTSVADPDNWPSIQNAIEAHIENGKRPFVVCSALAGVSDLLEQMLDAASADQSPDAALEVIRHRHHEFATRMAVDATSVIDAVCRRLCGLLRDSRSGGPIHASVRAEVMACGEILSTRIGARWLQQQGVSVVWRDARHMLGAENPPPGTSDSQRYLLASCSYERDTHLGGALRGLSDDVAVITQGFIASNDHDQTVLLGRGGSDTAAAYFAAKLNANRLEIWTDVPGMFTTNPQAIASARLLKSLSYDEAETLAGMGAKVLQPHCIHPVRAAGIPLHIRWTARPEVRGTVIEAALTDHANGVKAVTARKSLTLICMGKRAGWQPVGFMADVSSRFKKHALPIDLLASSSSNIRATLDLSTAPEIADKVPALVKDLHAVCRPKVYENVASVCLVGHEIRGTIHELAPTLTALEEQQILMLAQAANDLTFSFVLPEREADALVRRLHGILFENWTDEEHFGPTWAELTGDADHTRIDSSALTV